MNDPATPCQMPVFTAPLKDGLSDGNPCGKPGRLRDGLLIPTCDEHTPPQFFTVPDGCSIRIWGETWADGGADSEGES